MYTSHQLLLLIFSLCIALPVGFARAGSSQEREYNQYPQRSVNSNSSLAITGPELPKNHSGAIPQRIEVRQLQSQNPIQWNLYLLALHRFQAMGQSQRSSYYQIAGIHGRPFVPWDNVQFASGRTGGYCTHSSIIFLTWHRPYVALYEQQIYAIVQDIAGEFSSVNGSVYKTAAETFRIPFWDWAAPALDGQHVMPPSISSAAHVEVVTPNGTQTIPNPLYQYQFHPLNSTDLPDSPFSTWPNTLRYPDSNNVNATSQDGKILEELDQNQGTYAKRYLNLLESYSNYSKFSNKAWMPNAANAPGSYDSLESLHDAIHGLIGNGGHFTYNEYSAFDPVFFLHHANVDRLFAIWQAIYPNSWVPDTIAQAGTATIIPNVTLITENTPLTPFHRTSNGTFWTSKTIRNCETFGYTYPEIADHNVSCTKQAVNKLYGATAGAPLSKFKRFATNELNTRSGAQKRGTYYEWITNIRVAQNALNSTFTVYVFLGNFSDNPKSWLSDPNLVGSHTIFMPFSSEADQSAGLVVAGTVPLSHALRADAKNASGVDTGNQTEVGGYLYRNLHWRVAKVGLFTPPFASLSPLTIFFFLFLLFHGDRLLMALRTAHGQHRSPARVHHLPPRLCSQLPGHRSGERV